jgi:hypothetical protein
MTAGPAGVPRTPNETTGAMSPGHLPADIPLAERSEKHSQHTTSDLLSPEHRHMLEVDSGIRPDVIAARGYFTARTPADLARRGFAESQRNAPALVLPIHDVWGKVATYQARLDAPRSRDGKSLKYETVAGACMVLDVHPAIREHLGTPKRPLWITEGIKKADAALSHGLDCIALLGVWNWRGTNEQGGKTALPDFEAIALNGRRVYLAFDSDVIDKESVRLALSRLGAMLERRGADVRVIRLPNGPDGAKVGLDDYLVSGGSIADLIGSADTLDGFTAGPDLFSFNSFLSYSQPQPPQLHEAALHGLAGDVVRAFEPHTEADPAAILASFLVAFGNCVGPSPHAWVSETRHGLNLGACIVGATARSRKGTSWGPIARLFEQADRDWLHNRKASGIGSGEGVIWAMRDPSEPKTHPKTGETVIEDPGVNDKRLMVHEEEFSSILKVAGRDGSILSETVRKAWDGESPLRNLVKRSPVQATSPHVSFLGHITGEELRRELTEVSQANGLANRFLWVYAQRSKLLPDAPRLNSVTVDRLAKRMREALDSARRGGEIRRSDAAAAIWRTAYPDLTRDHPGLLGHLTARAEAHILRLSMVYAIIDCSPMVEPAHLSAAVAFWRYSEDSARFIFGDRTGDHVADTIRDALRDTPLTETQISDLFGRNQKAGRIRQALLDLQAAGFIEAEVVQTGGRPARQWRAVT